MPSADTIESLEERLAFLLLDQLADQRAAKQLAWQIRQRTKLVSELADRLDALRAEPAECTEGRAS